MTESLFPIQASRRPQGRMHPRSVPWSLAEIAYWSYEGLSGTDQSLERIAGLGGYGWDEFCELFALAHLGLDQWARPMPDKPRKDTMNAADRLNHAFRQGYAAAIVAKEGGESRRWKSWCSTHDSEQIRPGENICFRSPVEFPTVEAEAHRCRFDRRVLVSMPEPDQVGEPG